MINLSMLDIIRTGEITPLRLGMQRDDLENLLGPPSDWGIEQSVEHAGIWRYGDIEFHFDHSAVALIFTDHGNLLDGGSTLVIDPWIVHQGMASQDLESKLTTEGIAYAAAIPVYAPEQRTIRTDSIEFRFIEQPEEHCDQAGLVSWSIRPS